MKFLHVTISPLGELLKFKISKTGYFCWSRAFGTDPMQYVFCKGTLKDYDVIFVAISGAELSGMVITNIRREVGYGPDAPKIIACIDFAVQLWPTGYQPQVLRAELSQADLVFGPEQTMIGPLESITKRKVHIIDHPVDIEGISKVEASVENTTVPIVALTHRYDSNWYFPYLATMDLPWPCGVIMMNRVDAVQSSPYFEIKFQQMSFDDYLPWAKSRKVMIDSYHAINTWGRMQLECAILQVPCVGTSAVHTQKDLWPSLTTAPFDTYSQEQLIRKLMTDDEFRQEALTFAAERVHGYSFAARKSHLLKVLKEETGYEEGKEERTEETTPEGQEDDRGTTGEESCTG